MSNVDELFTELKPEIQALAGALFDATQRLVRKRGTFLPHGAVLLENAEVRMIMAAPPGFEERATSTLEVLPLLHDGLREVAREDGVRAVAVCEEVTISSEGRNRATAIKVLLEHRRGLNVALYMPYKRRLFGGYRFDPVFARRADAEIQAW